MRTQQHNPFVIDFSGLGDLPEDPMNRTPYFMECKSLVQEGKSRIKDWHRSGAGGREVVQAHTALMDQLIRHLLAQVEKVPPHRGKGLLEKMVLVAVGGYGRGELNPSSDIDLLFLHSKGLDNDLDRFIQDAISVLWGIGLEIGHSARTLSDCKALAMSDTTVRTSMIETRYLIGNERLYKKLWNSVKNDIVKKKSVEFLKSQLSDRFGRSKTVHLVSSNPEPNLKDGPGGLRDYHVALWAVACRFGVFSFREIGRDDVVTSQELNTLDQSVNFVLRVRNELHYLKDKKNDILSLDVQETLARNLGYTTSDEGHSPVEEFMQEYFLHATQIFNISEAIFQRCLEVGTLRRVLARFNNKDLGDGLVANKAVLSANPFNDHLFENKRELLLKVFDLCQKHALQPDTKLKRLIRNSDHLVDEQFIQSNKVVEFILKTLNGKSEPILRDIHDLGLLGKLLPEFDSSHCRVRFDFYHRFTTDEHALRMVHFLEDLENGDEEIAGVLVELYRELPDKLVLKLACLLNDLSQAADGNISEIYENISPLVKRLALDTAAQDQLAFLLGNLNLMNETAFHQDIHQPRTIKKLALKVGDPERLKLLFLITYVDLRAVAPGTWNAWKRILLTELYHRTHNYMLRPMSLEEKPAATRAAVLQQLDGEMDRQLVEKHFELMLEDYLVTAESDAILQHLHLIKAKTDQTVVMEQQYRPEGGYYDLVMACDQNPDTFMHLVCALTAKAMNILGAQIFTRKDGLAFIHLQVEGGELYKIHGESPEVWQEIETHFLDLIEKRVTPQALLTSRTRLTTQADSKAPIIPRIEIDNLLENNFTFMRIEARDHPGMLYKIARAFAHFNIQIHRSRVACRGGRGIDVFSLSQHGEKLHHKGLQNRVKDQVITYLLIDKLEDIH